MHMFSKEQRFLGGHGIVGGQAPLAVGVGFAIKYQEGDQIIVCYLGDAAMNQGAVFEAMNMAATWTLPVLFIIENNRYGMGTAITRTTSIDRLDKRALSFDMDHSQVDGMNVLTVHQEVQKIVTGMRRHHRPYLLEALTYRFKGHSVSDPGTYRTKEEVQEYMEIDPLITLSKHLVEQGHATAADLEKWDAAERDKVKAAEQFADAAPFADVAETWQHVFSEG